MFLLPLALTIFGSSTLSALSERFSATTGAGGPSFFALGAVFLAGFVSVGAAVSVAVTSETVVSFATDLAALGFLSEASVFFVDSAMIKLFQLSPLYCDLRRPFCAYPYWCVHWYLYVAPAPAIPGGVEFLGSN